MTTSATAGMGLSQYLRVEIESYFKIDNKWVTDDLARELYRELKACYTRDYDGTPYAGIIKIGYFTICIRTQRGPKFEVYMDYVYHIEDKTDLIAWVASYIVVNDIKKQKFPVTKQGLIDMIHFMRECKAAADRGWCNCGEPEIGRMKLPNADMCAKCFVQRILH